MSGAASSKNNSNWKKSQENVPRPMSLIDPEWELIDPNPDIFSLFGEFNKRFFWGALFSVEVRWSPRMTLCAGLCYYQRRAKYCSIRLSKPLLQLRPRKDFIETLLHEMIHAYLFVTENNSDHNAHGPNFHKHMYRINAEAGTKITVYHSFHDEVDHYRQHWWRCDGPCQKKPPFFGIVRRSMNREPGPNDRWWDEHRQTCNGKYHKIREPEGYGKPKGKAVSKSSDVTKSRKEKILSQKVTDPKQTKMDAFLSSPSREKNDFTKASVSGETASGSLSANSDIKEESLSYDQELKEYEQCERDVVNRKRDWSKLGVSVSNSQPISNPKASRLTDKIPKLSTSAEIVKCPVCNSSVAADLVNSHLDECLNEGFLKTETSNAGNIDDSVEDLGDDDVIPCDDDISEVEKNSVICPVCFQSLTIDVASDHINAHFND
ncbi:unnamed protein product [Notodromas monacha]|uniref:Protein with SprT-like domain at the N terminus n=1 Tax=Notodromas monacha TaxID=399045 RepID=A0A7R9BPM8_9CRUS|nr:unnamed protein product [Notodromas monacha]CAG0919113.1 unnamed protein product [Notodromas monacha]